MQIDVLSARLEIRQRASFVKVIDVSSGGKAAKLTGMSAQAHLRSDFADFDKVAEAVFTATILADHWTDSAGNKGDSIQISLDAGQTKPITIESGRWDCFAIDGTSHFHVVAEGLWHLLRTVTRSDATILDSTT